MCGRSANSRSRDNLREITGANRFVAASRYEASHNVCPGNWQPVIRSANKDELEEKKTEWQESSGSVSSSVEKSFDAQPPVETTSELAPMDVSLDEVVKGTKKRSREEIKKEIKSEVKKELKVEATAGVKDTKKRSREEIKKEIKSEVKKELKVEAKAEISQTDVKTLPKKTSLKNEKQLTKQETEIKIKTDSTVGVKATLDDLSDDEEDSSAKSAALSAKGAVPKRWGVDTVLHTMKWGLIPGYTKAKSLKDAGSGLYKTINARSEKITTSGVWRRLTKKRRCVIIADGFFEWHKIGASAKAKKQPYFVTMGDPNNAKGEKPMFMAGLWDRWKCTDPSIEEDYVYTYTILTTSASQKIGWLHHRMPVILNEENIEKWLNVDKYPIEECLEFLKPWAEKIFWRGVPSEYVGNTKNKSSKCVQDLKDYNAEKRTKGIHRFFKPKEKNPPTPTSGKKRKAVSDIGSVEKKQKSDR